MKNKEDIIKKLKEYNKTLDDIDDFFIKRQTLYVQFKGEDYFTELLYRDMSESDNKRPEDIITY